MSISNTMDWSALEKEADVPFHIFLWHCLAKSIKPITAAAELYMKALAIVTDPATKARLRQKCEKALDTAEGLKAGSNGHATWQLKGPGDGQALPPPPQPSEPTKNKEKIILLKGSKLNGFVFPPWKDDPSADDFILKEGDSLFCDEPTLELSEEQLELFDDWQRVSELSHESSATDAPRGPHVDLVQDVATDCSVVASMCAGTARAERGHPSLLRRIIWPFDQSNRKPAVSANGKYIFKLYFNGCFRRVVIDDRLPSSASSRSLYVVDRGDKSLLWPALFEKAYLKVRGGYDFPGSNSGTDIWVLTGWIPEQIFLQSDEIDPLDLWKTIFSAFHEGNVLLTLGTGKLSAREEKFLGLAAEHDYAILDLREVGEHRYLLIKNPWASGKEWQGDLPLNEDDESHDTADGSEPPTIKALTTERKLTAGTFWMDLNNVMQNFETAYLNWQPSLFPSRQDTHFSWNLVTNTEAPGCFAGNPQFVISSQRGGEVCLVVGRHFVSHETALLKVLAGSPTPKSQLGFLSIYVFSASGYRVMLSDGALRRGPYVDSPQTMMRLDIPPKTSYTIVISEQWHYPLSYNFTLTSYSREHLDLREAPAKYPHCPTFAGSWTKDTAGGNATSPTYPTNPQYGFALKETSSVALLLDTLVPELHVHIKLVHSGGKRVAHVTHKDILGASGDYRLNSALAEISDVPPGQYTIVCSTFSAGQLGAFNLRVYSMRPCLVWPLPAEYAGRFVTHLPVAVFRPDMAALAIQIDVRRLSRLSTVARWAQREDGGIRSALVLAVERGRGVHKSTIAVSREGQFSDAVVGVRVGEFDLDPRIAELEGYWITLRRRNTDSLEKVKIEVFSEGGITAGMWEELEE